MPVSEDEATMPDDGQADVFRDIDHKREALAAYSEGHPDRVQRASELGEILCTGYQQIGDVALINEGIEFQREALALHPQSYLDRARSCSDLGLALYEHYKQVRDVAILNEAIELQRKALALRPPGHPDRAFSCNNLGSLLRARYEQCGDLTPLNESIELNREALALRPPGHPDRALSCNDLGVLLHARYSQCGDLTLLDEAIELKREALALQPPGHPEHAAKCGSLATSLHSRYKQCGDFTLLNEAIKLKCEAMALQPPGHPDRALSCNNLATSLHERYEQCGDLTLLNEAIKLKREALALRPPGHPNRSISCRQLSLSLIDYYERTKDAALLDEAIKLCGYTLEHDTSMNSRSFVILSVLHLIPDTSHFSTVKALHYLDVSLGSEVDNIRDLIRDTSYSLSQLWSLPIIWTTETKLLLSNIYTKIIDRLPLAVGFVLDTPSRLQFLKFRHHLGTDACVAAVLANQPSTAVELLDRAHGLIWTQALHQRDPQMEGAPPELASELAGLLREIAAPLTTQLNDLSYASRQDSRHRQNTRIQVLLRQIRAAKPGLERFMLGSTYDTLREAARDHPVVVLAAGRGHAFALIMSSAANGDHPHALHLDLKLDDLQSLQSAAQEAGLRSTAERREGEEPDSRLGLQKSGLHVDHKPLRVLAKIWHKIVKPVLDHLKLEKASGRSRPRLHWCANGGFVFLPLHAAGIYKGPTPDQVCCSDYVVSSYTPTISALLRAQARATSVAPSGVDMLLVGEDCAKNPALSRLWSVRKELECIELLAKSQQFGHNVEVIGSAATVQQVTERVKSTSFVHLACHGIQDQTDALESGFYLSDGKLTISKLMDLQLDKPWLAYLSACETAKGDAEQPDQVMHLAAAMLFAGFKHVVATMWVMGDDDGPDLAQWFYQELMSHETINADAVAYALDDAVQKLRAKGLSPQRWAPFIHMGA